MPIHQVVVEILYEICKDFDLMVTIEEKLRDRLSQEAVFSGDHEYLNTI